MSDSIQEHEGVSPRVKLVLSYLAVALSAILLMVIVVAIAVQNYFYQTQIGQLRAQAEVYAQQAVPIYQQNGNSWTNIMLSPDGPPKFYFAQYLVIVDTQGVSHTSLLPPSFNSYDTTLQQALSQSLHGQETDGKLEGNP